MTKQPELLEGAEQATSDINNFRNELIENEKKVQYGYSLTPSECLSRSKFYGKTSDYERVAMRAHVNGTFEPRDENEKIALLSAYEHAMFGYENGRGQILGKFLRTNDSDGNVNAGYDEKTNSFSNDTLLKAVRQYVKMSAGGDEAVRQYLVDNIGDKDWETRTKDEQFRISCDILGYNSLAGSVPSRKRDAEYASDGTVNSVPQSVSMEIRSEAKQKELEDSADKFRNDTIEEYLKTKGDKLGILNLDAMFNTLNATSEDGKTLEPDVDAANLVKTFIVGRNNGELAKLWERGNRAAFEESVAQLLNNGRIIDGGTDGAEYQKRWRSAQKALHVLQLLDNSAGLKSGGSVSRYAWDVPNALLSVEQMVEGWADGIGGTTSRTYNKVANATWRSSEDAKIQKERQFIADELEASITPSLKSNTWVGLAGSEALKMYSFGKLFSASISVMGKLTGAKPIMLSVAKGAKAAKAAEAAKVSEEAAVALKKSEDFAKSVAKYEESLFGGNAGVSGGAFAERQAQLVGDYEKLTAKARELEATAAKIAGPKWNVIKAHMNNLMLNSPALFDVFCSGVDAAAISDAGKYADKMKDGFDEAMYDSMGIGEVARGASDAAFMMHWKDFLGAMRTGAKGNAQTQGLIKSIEDSFEAARKSGNINEALGWMLGTKLVVFNTLNGMIRGGNEMGMMGAANTLIDGISEAHVTGKLDLDSLAKNLGDSYAESFVAGAAGVGPMAFRAGASMAARARLPYQARLAAAGIRPDKIVATLAGCKDHDEFIKLQTGSVAEVQRFNNAKTTFAELLSAYDTRTGKVDMDAVRKALEGKYSEPIIKSVEGIVKPFLKDLALNKEMFFRSAVLRKANPDSVIEDLRKIGLEAVPSVDANGGKVLTVTGKRGGKTFSGKFLFDNGEVYYQNGDGTFQKGAVESIIAEVKNNPEHIELRRKLDAISLDQKKMESLLNGVDVDGFLSDAVKSGKFKASGVYVSNANAVGESGAMDANVSSATGGKGIGILDGLVRIGKGENVLALRHEVFHACLDVMQKSGVLTPEEVSALKLVYGGAKSGGGIWEEVLNNQWEQYTANTLEGALAKKVLENASKTIGAKMKDGAKRLVGFFKKAQVEAKEPVATLEAFLNSKLKEALAVKKEYDEAEARDKAITESVEKAKKEAEAKASEIVEDYDDPIEYREPENDTDVAEPSREVKDIPVDFERMFGGGVSISDEIFNSQGKDFMKRFGLTEDQLEDAMYKAGYAHDSTTGMWVNKSINPTVFNESVARNAQAKMAAGKKLNVEEMRRIGVIQDQQTGRVIGTCVRIDGEIDGSEVAVDSDTNQMMSNNNFIIRPIDGAPSEIIDGAREQFRVQSGKFAFRNPENYIKAGEKPEFMSKLDGFAFRDDLKDVVIRMPDFTKKGLLGVRVQRDSLGEFVANYIEDKHDVELAKIALAGMIPNSQAGTQKYTTKHGRQIKISVGGYQYGTSQNGYSEENGQYGIAKVFGKHGAGYVREEGHPVSGVFDFAEFFENFDDVFQNKYLDAAKSNQNSRGVQKLVFKMPHPHVRGVNFIGVLGQDGELISFMSDRNAQRSIDMIRSMNAREVKENKVSSPLYNRGESTELKPAGGEDESIVSKKTVGVNGTEVTMLGEQIPFKSLKNSGMVEGIKNATGGFKVFPDGYAKFLFVGERGLGNLVNAKDANGKPLFSKADLDDTMRKSTESFVSIAEKIKTWQDDGRERVDNWKIEKELGEKGFDVGLKSVGGKKLLLHFTGAYNDAAPRFEFASGRAEVKAGAETEIEKGCATLGSFLGNVPEIKALYPELWDSPVALGGERGYELGTIVVKGLYKNGEEATIGMKTNERGELTGTPATSKLSVNLPRMRDGRKEYSKIGVTKNGAFIIFADKITAENAKQISDDLNEAICASIGRIEGWDSASNWQDGNPKSPFTGKDWQMMQTHTGRRMFFGDMRWSNYQSPFKYYLFSDAKLSITDPNSVAGKVIEKTVNDICKSNEKKNNPVAEKDVREQVLEAIRDMLNSSFDRFSCALEAQAQAGRMGKTEDKLLTIDDSLLRADRDGFIRSRKGGASEQASKRVQKFWSDEISAAISKAVNSPEVKDKFSKYFTEEVRKRTDAARIAHTIDRIISTLNHGGVRKKEDLAKVNAALRKKGLPEISDVQWMNWKSMGGSSDKVGRQEYTEEQRKIAESQNKKLAVADSATATREKNGKEGGTALEGATKGVFGTGAGSTEAKYETEGLNENDVKSPTDTDKWESEKNAAIEEAKALAASLKGGKIDAAVMGKIMSIVERHMGQGEEVEVTDASGKVRKMKLNRESTETVMQRARGLFEIAFMGKKPTGGAFRFTTRSPETVLTSGAAAKLAYAMQRRRHDDKAFEKAVAEVRKTIEAEASKFGLPEASKKAWADGIISNANSIARNIIGRLSDAEAKVNDRKDALSEKLRQAKNKAISMGLADMTVLLREAQAEADRYSLASEIYREFSYGYKTGRDGENEVEKARNMVARSRASAMRRAVGLKIADISAMTGYDVMAAVSDIGSGVGRFTDGKKLAEDITSKMYSAFRSRFSEFATMTDAELGKLPEFKNWYSLAAAEVIGKSASMLGYGRTRVSAVKDSVAIKSVIPPSIENIEKSIARNVDKIAAGIREVNKNELVDELGRYIEKVAKTAGQMSENTELWRRDFAPRMQEFWKFVREAIDKNCNDVFGYDEEDGTHVKGEIDRLQELAEMDDAELAKLKDKKVEDIAVDDLMERDLAHLKIRALEEYGALRERSTSDVMTAYTVGMAELDAQLARHLAEVSRRRTVDGVKCEAIVEGLKPYRNGEYAVDKKSEPKKKFLFMMIPDMFKRFGMYFKEGSEAKRIVDEMSRGFSNGHIQMNRIISQLEGDVVRFVESHFNQNYGEFLREWCVERPEYEVFSRSNWAIPKSGFKTEKVWTGDYYKRDNAKLGVKKGDKVMRTIRLAEDGADKTLAKTKLSKLNLVYIWAAGRQKDMEVNNRIYGKNEAYYRDIENIIGAEGIALATEISRKYDTMRSLVSPVAQRITGLPVRSPDVNYCPLEFTDKPSAEKTTRYNVAPFPSFLRNRGNHDSSRLKENQNLLDVFGSRLRDAAHYVAFGELADRTKSVFCNPSVMAQYYNVLGVNTAKAMYEQLEKAFNGGYISPSDSFGSSFRNFVTHTTLGYNPASAIKQLEGIGGWNLFLGGRAWVGALTWNKVFDRQPLAYAMTELRDVFATRGMEGITQPMADLIAAKEQNFGKSKVLDWYRNNSMWMTAKVDKLASSACAGTYFLGRLDFYRAQGIMEDRFAEKYAECKRCNIPEDIAREQAQQFARMTEQEAVEAASADTDYAIQVSQQSGRVEFLNEFQRSGVAGKLITQFAGPSYVRFGEELEAIHRAVVLKDKGAVKNLVRKAIAGHVVCPAILSFAGQLTNFVFGSRDDKNAELFDGFAENLFISMALGPWSGMFVLGAVLDTTVREGYYLAKGGENFNRKHYDIPVASKLGRIASLTARTAYDATRLIGTKDITKEFCNGIGKDIIDGVQSVAPITRTLNAPVNIVNRIQKFNKTGK